MEIEYTCEKCLKKFRRQSNSKQITRFCSNDCRFNWKTATKEEKINRTKEAIDKNTDKSSGCWIWTGYIGKTGYPLIGYDGKATKAHRVSYLIYKGEIPKELQVCHTCDNRACLNPEHLWLGTAKDNAQDRDRKGRKGNSLGSKNGMAKLSENQVIEIKKMLNQGKSLPEIAKNFSVTKNNIWCIKKGIRWGYLNVSP